MNGRRVPEAQSPHENGGDGTRHDQRPRGRTSTAPVLHAIVLAAGCSRRFGSPKQLVKLDGELLLHRAIASAGEVAGSAVTVVLGANAAEIAAVLPPVGLHVNREWREGIGSSIRSAVRALPGACDGVLIVLADQPKVTAASLRRLVMAWHHQPRQIIASRYSAVTGVPAIFPRWCFEELSALRGDVGARAVIARHEDRVVPILVPEAEVDIDRPEDLLELGK
jgi:molybdenum cofactor cytidylyltransferase